MRIRKAAIRSAHGQAHARARARATRTLARDPRIAAHSHAQSTVTTPMLPKLSIMVLMTAVSLTMPP